MKPKLVTIEDKSTFQELNQNNEYDKSIVFVLNSGEIYTHGVCFSQYYVKEKQFIFGDTAASKLGNQWKALFNISEYNTGTYAIQLTYQEGTKIAIYSGVFTINNLNVNTSPSNFESEEIPLHKAGSSLLKEIYVKTGYKTENNIANLYLYLSAEIPDNQYITQGTCTVKISKII